MRKCLANLLAGWARRLYPESKEVMSFYMDRMVEHVITGQSNIKMSWVDTSPDAAQQREPEGK